MYQCLVCGQELIKQPDNSYTHKLLLDVVEQARSVAFYQGNTDVLAEAIEALDSHLSGKKDPEGA